MAASQNVYFCVDFGTHGFFVTFCHPNDPAGARVIDAWPQMPASEYEKNLTAILLSKEDPEYAVVGFEAQNTYLQASDEEKANMMYFTNFKLDLLQSGELDTTKRVSAICNTSKKLCSLISQCLLKIIEHSLQRYRLITSISVELNEALWIITVPATWKLSSCVAMKQCCKAVGIDEANVRIVPEPQAAGAYCVHESEERKAFEEFDTYGCIDLGGGTYDIICHEVGEDLVLHDRCAVFGGKLGGVDVDNAFLDFLRDLVGVEVLQEFQIRHPAEFVEQLNTIRSLRESSGPAKPQRNLNLKGELTDIVNEHKIDLKKRCAEFRLPGCDDPKLVVLKGRRKLVIKEKIWRFLHQEAIGEVLCGVRKLFDQVPSVEKLFLVGGFSMSAYIREEVKTLLENEFSGTQLFTLDHPELAVAKGGLWYAAKKTGRRLLPWTYGIGVEREWRRTDPIERRLFDESHSGYKIENVFQILFEKDFEWTSGDSTREDFEYTVGAGVRKIALDLYQSENPYPAFVDEDGCTRQGQFTYELPEEHVSLEEQTILIQYELTHDAIRMFVKLWDDVKGMKHSNLCIFRLTEYAQSIIE